VTVTEADENVYDAFGMAIRNNQFLTAQWLVEYGGTDVSNSVHKDTLWDLVLDVGYNNSAARTALLRAMLLRCDKFTPSTFGTHALLETGYGSWIMKLVQEGVRLRARLPAYLVQRRALLETHCPLIKPLRAIVSGYEVSSATEDLWATGLGAAP
jgi:hypothetical protein